MTSRWQQREHPLAIASLDAIYTAVLAGMAATGHYQPAPPAGPDTPAEWACRPDRFARFRCACGARFHVRRHLEAHTTTCTTRDKE